MITLFGKDPRTFGCLHFVGIGGVGMSALAEYLHDAGFDVQGSDVSENANVKRLLKKGVRIFAGHHKNHIDKAFRIVVSSAIKEGNVEVLEASRRGIRTLHRSELLAEIIRQTTSVAVSGTHGKTTTSTMVFHVLGYGGLEPGIVTGGIIRGIKSGAVLGGSRHFVAEADESDGSFTRMHPMFAIVTNMDPEHMDHYGDEEGLFKAYVKFVKNVRKGGAAILCADDERVLELVEHIKGYVITYGFSDKADVRAHNLEARDGKMHFDVYNKEDFLGRVALNIVGDHNVQNALASIAVGLAMNVPFDAIEMGLNKYHGVRRRFQILGQSNHGVTVVDDYAHHPVEIKATLNAARQQYDGTRVIAVVQPHRYSRLQGLMSEFAESVQQADEILLCPVYAAGESPIEGVDDATLATEIQKTFEGPVNLVSTAEDLAIHVRDHAQSGDVVLCMGAGSISQWAHSLMKSLS